MSYIISGIQQVGIGVANVDEAWEWYRKHFGMDVPVFREAADAPLMTRYTGGVVHSRDAVLALNLQGGSGMEIWQFTSRSPSPPSFEIQLGDLGVLATRVKSPDVQAAHQHFARTDHLLTGDLIANPAGEMHFFVSDPSGNLFDIVSGDAWFTRPRHTTGGPAGCMIGVSNIDESLILYRDLLGYDQTVYDEKGVFADVAGLPGGTRRVRRILLAHSEYRTGPFSQLFGPSRLELIESLDEPPRKIFDSRFWGDLGFIHLCFDIRGMEELRSACENVGFTFTVDSKDSFDMGEAAGRFAYIEDRDGTLIEFVETHKMPLIKKLGLHLDLRKRAPEKPLPRWMIKALGLGRVKN